MHVVKDPLSVTFEEISLFNVTHGGYENTTLTAHSQKNLQFLHMHCNAHATNAEEMSPGSQA